MLAPENLPPDDVGLVLHPGTGESHDGGDGVEREDAAVAVIGEFVVAVVREVECIWHVLEIVRDPPVETGVAAALCIDVVHRFPLGAVAIFDCVKRIPERLHDIA